MRLTRPWRKDNDKCLPTSLIEKDAPSEALEAIPGVDTGYFKLVELPAGQTLVAACAMASPDTQASGEMGRVENDNFE